MQKGFCHIFCKCLIVGLCSSITLAGEQLKNSDFKQGLSSWSFHVHKRIKVKRKVTNGVLAVQISEASKPQHVQLIQKVTLLESQQYQLSFDAKRNGKPTSIQVLCMQQRSPYKSYGLNKSVELSDTWSRHQLTFTVQKIVEDNPPTLRLFLGNQTSVALRKFSLVKQSDIEIPTAQTSVEHKKLLHKNNSTLIRIVPQPKQLTRKNGTFQLGQTLFIQTNQLKAFKLFKQEAIFITGKLQSRFQRIQHSSNSFFLGIANTADVDLFDQIAAPPHHQGGYTFAILPQGIAIKGHDDEGLRNGVQSLLQVLEQAPNGMLPQIVVRDLPDLNFRAMHLALRPPSHWKVKTHQDVYNIYRWIFRRLGRYKYTHVCLMIKGTLKFKKHSQVWPNAVYSHDDIKAIIKIGEEHGLTLFPELKTLGKFFFDQPKETLQAHADMLNRKIATHAGAWKSIFHESWSEQRLNAEQKTVKVDGSISVGLNIANPKVVPLMLDCIDEIYELFGQPKLFSLGMDEAHFFGTSWPKEVHRGRKFADYANTLSRHLKSKDCRSIIWGDMLLSHLQFPYFFENHGGPPANICEAMPYLDDDIIIADWHYGYTVGDVLPEHYPTISWFRQNGKDVIAVPWFIQHNMSNLARDVAATSSKGLMGSCWSLHQTYTFYTRKNAFQKKSKTHKTVQGRRELGVFASTAEAAWSILQSKKNMEQYDSVQWEKRWLPEKN